MERSVPTLRVQIGQEIVLRSAELEVLERDASGRAIVMHLRPQLRAGEILCERMGDIPLIVSLANCAPLAHPAEAMGFDSWMLARTDAAHSAFMKRTSAPLPCDWRVFPPEAISRYFGIPVGELA